MENAVVVSEYMLASLHRAVVICINSPQAGSLGCEFNPLNEASKCAKCNAVLPDQRAEGFCPACQTWLADSAADAETITSVIQALPGGGAHAALPGDGETFGDYEIIEEIARGGMGVVFKARQKSLNRIVALKMIRGERLVDDEGIQRFHVEARAAAQLHHPNIVAIHEVGAVRGQNFYCMDFIAGASLSSLARDHPLSPKQAARYVRKIAQAIHYAHSRHIIHRDLKPANVLIDQNDEPQVTDFGLAKFLQGEAGSTLSGTVMGSPSYMPPEQASGDTRRVGAQSDVYGLGAVLYELLCGRPPFRADSTMETLRQVMEKDPVAPRLQNPKVPRDLETICLKCLEKSPGRRYSTALQVAEELARFQNDEPIFASPVSAPARLWRWCRRKPALAAVGAFALLLVGVISVGSPIAALKLNHARLLAEQRELKARRNAYGADMGIVQGAIDQRRFSYAEQLLASHRPAAGQMDVRGWEWRYLWDSCRRQPVTPLALHTGNVSAITVSPDGRWIASADDKRTLKLWNVAGKQEVLTVKGCAGPGPALSDKLLAAPDPTGHIRFWSLAALQNVGPSIQSSGKLSLIQFHPGGESLITYGDAQLRIWDVASGRLSVEHTLPGGKVTALSRDGATLAVSSGQREITVWRADGRPPLAIDSGHLFAGQPLTLALSGDGRTLVAAVAFGVGADFRLRIWDLESGLPATNFPAHADRVTSANFSADDSHLVTTSYDRTVEVRERGTWRTVSTLRSGDSLAVVTLLPQAGLLLSGGRHGAVQARELQAGDPGHGRIHLDLALEIISETRGGIAPDGSAVAAFHTNGAGFLFHPRESRARKELALPVTNVTRVAVGPAGRLLAIDGGAGLELWATTGPARVASLTPPGASPMGHLAFSPDERWLAGVSKDRGFHLWSLTSAAERRLWEVPPADGVAVQFSPDSKQLAIGHRKGTISVWDVATGRRSVELPGHDYQINRVAISHDGRQLASTGWDATVRVWDLATGRETANFRGSRSSFFRVSFSPDGRRLFVNEWSDALLFDLEAGRQVARLQSFTPLFLDDDTVLGLSETELWHWRPPSLKTIDAIPARGDP